MKIRDYKKITVQEAEMLAKMGVDVVLEDGKIAEDLRFHNN